MLGLDNDDLFSAFQVVKENHGAAGVDGVSIARFEDNLERNLTCLRDEVLERRYFPLPLLQLLVDKGKGDGQARRLCIPAVRDRVLQKAALDRIEPILESQFEDGSFGYRKGRSVRLAVHKIQEYYERGYRWVVEADIDAFFDSVDHDLLLAKARRYIPDADIVALLEQWARAEVWDGAALTRMDKGIPQGSPVSPVLANLFLDELDEALLARGYKYVRYADDFIVLCKTPEQAAQALVFTKEVLETMRLAPDEAAVTSFDKGFSYLGLLFVRSLVLTPYEHQPRPKKVLAYPAPLDLDAYLRRRVLPGGGSPV